MQPRMAVNVAQHKIVNLPKTFFFSSVFVSVCVFNVWPGITLLLPVWPRDAKRLDTPATLSPHLLEREKPKLKTKILAKQMQ